jgi:hypothetical protein
LEPEATRSAICMAEEGQFGSLVPVWNHWVFLGQKQFNHVFIFAEYDSV